MICEAISDVMPGVARGESSWDAEEAAHMHVCADCQREWALIQRVVAGRPTAPKLDLDRLAAGVVAATPVNSKVLAMPSHRRGWTRGLIGLAAAAGIAIVAYGLRPPATVVEVSAVPARVTTAIPELDALLEEELRVVLASLTEKEETTTNLTPGPLPRLGELTEAELDALLSAVEG